MDRSRTETAAVRAGGTLAASAPDDTNAVVPAGATKVRVLHLAPNAGEIQVFRTQPDFATPIEWQFPTSSAPWARGTSAPGASPPRWRSDGRGPRPA